MTADEIAQQLTAARAAAENIADRAPLGLRAVEPGRGRWYLCAFDGPQFLCLTGDLVPERSSREIRDAAAAGLLYERLEQYVDGERLRELAAAASRVVARGEEDAAAIDALVSLAHEALGLAEWSDAPERIVAALANLDEASRRHERVRLAYSRFVAATDRLVAVQDTLDPERMAALRAVEEAAGEAEIGESLARRLGAAMDDCDAAAAQVVAAHITRTES
jgi:hypothetical protein